MPLYEYQCQSCGERTEVLQKLADDPLTECETCGGALKRLISAPAVQFKGSGWYVTDYAGKGEGKGKGKEGDGSGEKKDAGPASGADKGAGDSTAAKGQGAGSAASSKPSSSKPGSSSPAA